MIFGNLGDDCGTGVCFTRNPSTGENKLYGEFLINAQGEDVVAGIRTPMPIAELEQKMPEIYKELCKLTSHLEKTYRNMQDIEFTIERGKLFLLQTRDGKRTASAAVKVAVDMVNEGLIDTKTAVTRVSPEQVEMLLHRQVDKSATLDIIAKGLPASPGAGAGMLVFSADEAEEWAKQHKPTILARPETSPDDIHGLFASNGVVTSRGGMTLRKCCHRCRQRNFDCRRQSFQERRLGNSRRNYRKLPCRRGKNGRCNLQRGLQENSFMG